MWADLPMVSFDLETTGVDVEADRIVTASIVRVTAGERSVAEWLVDPGIEIPQEATDVHGITTAQARADGVPTVECLPALVESLAAYASVGEPIRGAA
jgi:DNA polymerase-3 subunit epsilon